MKTISIYLILMIMVFCSCNTNKEQEKKEIKEPNNTLIGKWVRIGHTVPISFNFKENGLVEGDFGNDQTVDVVAKYEISGDTIKFVDKEGQMCEGVGQYKLYKTDYYLSFDLISDECGGRIKSTMGFWTTPNFSDLIKTLDTEIANSPKPDLYLNRARIYLATGKPQEAKNDFDTYISNDTTNARVYVNRAGTRFPDDLEGVVADCNKAIELEPNNKNAYFLRGLARYDLGEKEKACDDFSRAIESGFSVLRIAEQQKCAEFWESEK